MFTYYEKNETAKPIKIWLSDQSAIEDGCFDQAKAIANLPFVFKWLALMPDTHLGAGMPIGGVLATKNTIVPYAVGMDIGCGMCYVQTDIHESELTKNFIQSIVNETLFTVPVGKARHRAPQNSAVIDMALAQKDHYELLSNAVELLENAYYQVGTLGGGNHFIEFQKDENGYLGIMLHSGSRHLGAQICQTFQKIAVTLNKQWYSDTPEQNKLAFLPTNSPEGKAYIEWMNLALDYAYENREAMLEATMTIFTKHSNKKLGRTPQFTDKINCHHNYASFENHYGENVWVHRKGATRARAGELGIIPGAMGATSYLVRGLGNPESFHSSSHGAGRSFSRTRAKSNFPMEEVLQDLNEHNISIGKKNLQDVAEESRFAYKNIDEVMQNQTDLVETIKKLTTLGVVKG
ncbi:RtcB family protein [Listeria grandensis]|uniref:RtcB family protein n=1 Tax=Listeria grandensis TaxID=1494963 RepID=UPI00164EB0E6|nr:RtcB family protein [Listeria grandensis]MBC6316335.1 RtcB family protein [Listeria grandensis]